MNTPLEEKIIHLEHNQEIILKSLEQIKAHLWRQPENVQPKEPTLQDALDLQEAEALTYFETVIRPKAEGIGAQGFWQGAVANFLKTQALNYVGTILKEAAIEKMVELSQFLLEKLQGQVIKMYNRASDKEKQIFKDKIKEVYPDSELLKKLG